MTWQVFCDKMEGARIEQIPRQLYLLCDSGSRLLAQCGDMSIWGTLQLPNFCMPALCPCMPTFHLHMPTLTQQRRRHMNMTPLPMCAALLLITTRTVPLLQHHIRTDGS